MDNYPFILFGKTPEQLRRLGACGGRISGRNHRVRRALMVPPPRAVPEARTQESTVAAIAALDKARAAGRATTTAYVLAPCSTFQSILDSARRRQ